MNRLFEAPLSCDPVTHDTSDAWCEFNLDFPDYSLATHGPGDPALAAFCPLNYESKYAYPLLVWLHSQGEDETQLRQVMPLISLRNYIGIAVRGVERLSLPGGSMGFGWKFRRGDFAASGERVLWAVDRAENRFHVSHRRVFLAGCGTGGTMAMRIAMQHPERFAGVLSMFGGFPRGQMPLTRLACARKVPVFLASGRDCVHYPPLSVCEDLRLLHAAGMSVSMRQYPGGDTLSALVLGDVDRWIMEQMGASTGATVIH